MDVERGVPSAGDDDLVLAAVDNVAHAGFVAAENSLRSCVEIDPAPVSKETPIG